LKSEYLSIRIEPRVKEVLQRRADNKQHTLSETVTQILIDRLIDEKMLIRMKEIFAKLMIKNE